MGNYFHILEEFKHISEEIFGFITNFDSQGTTIYKGSRNELKVIEIEGAHLNIKRFKTPNLINRLVYRRLRKSKAERSFQHAQLLLKCNIGTPKPVAFFEKFSALGIKESYYVSMHQTYDFTFRTLEKHPNIEQRNQIIRAFAKFTFQMHEHDIWFQDHSAGNTLVELREDGGFAFYLVDLNRMKFKTLSYLERIKNFERLTINPAIIQLMGETYAELMQKPKGEVVDLMQEFALAYKSKFQKKKELKRKLKFWKN